MTKKQKEKEATLYHCIAICYVELFCDALERMGCEIVQRKPVKIKKRRTIREIET